MKKLYHIILLIIFCIVLNPAFAKDYEIANPDDDSATDDQNDDSVTDDQTTEHFRKEQKKGKKKKGERNSKVQPNKEDDENIILELDKT